MNEILDAMQAAFSAAFGSAFTAYFKGRQAVVAQDSLPILMVYPVATRQKRSGTLRDSAEYDIAVEVRISAKQYFDNATGQGSKLDTLEALVSLIEDRDDSGNLEDGTVMGIINNNITIANRVLYNDDMEVRYESYLEAGKFPAAKAVVTFTAFDRPNR